MHLYTAADTLKKSDQDLLAMAAAEAHLAFPEVKGHFVHGVVRRNEASQTCFIVPQKADSLYVETPWQGISACGDWVGFPHPAMNMERSVITAIAAANAIITAQGGEPYPIQPARPAEFGTRLVSGLVRVLRWIIGPLARLFRRK
jgi:isorenieratene synthase